MPHVFNPEGRKRLDAKERDEWQKPEEVVSSLEIAPGMAVADIGAGTGYFTTRIADRLGPQGRVYAVDTQHEMLEALLEKIAAGNRRNVLPIYSDGVRIPLPDAEVDLVFAANVAHEFGDLGATLAECRRILKPEGRLAVVDWRAEPTPVGPPEDHRLPEDRLIATLRTAGFSRPEILDLLPYHYFVISSL